MLIAAILAGIAMGYPILRSYDLIPLSTITHWAGSFGPDRAQSFMFRVDNEDILLKKAAERQLFGWGIWGRNRVYDKLTGEDLSVTDGTWIITLGTYGLIGYLSFFGLMALPVMMAWRIMRRGYSISAYTAGLCVILSMNLIDLLPNSSLNNVTLLIAGAILGAIKAPRPATSSSSPVMSPER